MILHCTYNNVPNTTLQEDYGELIAEDPDGFYISMIAELCSQIDELALAKLSMELPENYNIDMDFGYDYLSVGIELFDCIVFLKAKKGAFSLHWYEARILFDFTFSADIKNNGHDINVRMTREYAPPNQEKVIEYTANSATISLHIEELQATFAMLVKEHFPKAYDILIAQQYYLKT